MARICIRWQPDIPSSPSVPMTARRTSTSPSWPRARPAPRPTPSLARRSQLLTRNSMDIEVRLAVPEEALEITRVHIATWRDAYRGILPTSHLDALDETSLVRRRETSLRASDLATFVATRSGQIVGY